MPNVPLLSNVINKSLNNLVSILIYSPVMLNYGIKPYSLLQVAIPFGLGAPFRLNEVLDLWIDIGFRYTFTDYLDDVSKNYVDLNKIKDPLAQALSYRSNEISNPGLQPMLK
jgi:hypothetical protein